MKFELKNQEINFDIDIKDRYPLLWHYNDKDEKVNDLSVEPCHAVGSIKGNLTVQVDADLEEFFELFRTIGKLHAVHIKKIQERLRKEICQEVSE